MVKMVLNSISLMGTVIFPSADGQEPSHGVEGGVLATSPLNRRGGVIVALIALPGNSCQNKTPLIGFIKAASMTPGD